MDQQQLQFVFNIAATILAALAAWVFTTHSVRAFIFCKVFPASVTLLGLFLILVKLGFIVKV